jgi:hypothetical protein
MLIAEGLDVLYIARQAGHASVKETLDRYSHLFDRQRHADRARDALEARFAAPIGAIATDGQREVSGGTVVDLPLTR